MYLVHIHSVSEKRGKLYAVRECNYTNKLHDRMYDRNESRVKLKYSFPLCTTKTFSALKIRNRRRHLEGGSEIQISLRGPAKLL